ncbi:hypothetical protein D1872_324880 [compost metagenome]
MLKLVEQRNLLVVAVFQLIQRLANRLNIALAQHFTDQLKLAATAFFFDSLCQFNGTAQIRVEREFIQRVFTQLYHFRAKLF